MEDEKDNDSIPLTFSLSQNYPNPFNPITTIRFTIPQLETRHTLSLQLKVYNILGNEIATLVDEEKSPGEYSVKFSVGADSKSVLPNGIYFYTLSIGDRTLIKKMLLLK